MMTIGGAMKAIHHDGPSKQPCRNLNSDSHCIFHDFLIEAWIVLVAHKATDKPVSRLRENATCCRGCGSVIYWSSLRDMSTMMSAAMSSRATWTWDDN